MDDVSNFIIDYTLIRKPKFKTHNIFAYAAKIDISINRNLYLSINDFAICDFICQIEQWLKRPQTNFEFIPQDGTDIVLKFSKVENEYIITSQWTNKLEKLDSEMLINYLFAFIKKKKKDCKYYIFNE